MKKIISIFGLFIFTQCTFFDTLDEGVMFLEFDLASFSTTSGQGVNTHKIQDIHVFADGFSIGVFNLPARVPVLSDDNDVKIDVFAVIRNNGIASNPIQYPFYDKIAFDLVFEDMSTKKLDLNFEYNSDAQQIVIADFEGNNPLSQCLNSSADVEFIRSRETPYGDFCGKITFPEAGIFFEKTTFLRVPRSVLTSSEVYLEMDYKCDTEFGVGLVLETSTNGTIPAYKIVLNPQEEWNKIYIEFTQELSPQGIDEFTVLFGSGLTQTQAGSIWVDNLRFVHY